MKIAITGGRGQLGRELVRVLGAAHQVTVLDLPECDVTLPAVIDTICDLRPDLVIHAAAMTDVEGCARDPLAAYRANALATQNVALACQRSRAVLLHISTNEVFDGTKPSAYLEMDETRAINPYGASKLAAERFVQSLLYRFYIVRPSWLFSPGGNNFPNRIIALARERGALAVVTDEIANPTYAPDLAAAIAALIQTEHFGIYHLVNEGTVSRYDWTAQILSRAGLGEVPLTPIVLADYQRLSNPPRNGALANVAAATSLGIRLRPWQEALDEFFRVQQGCA
jgi:dTDP-4-dehydrorhamnose reductase